ncbi:site-specific integrase [Lichenibacterium minor]|uniref:Site-specific integrase n=1 Tax=Lichenibacterium minor TaxID=2316528 RepID=A0A4Q2TZF4_9HYPH|nr:site-specific integrase [Lichenibacterium minor]RYC29140.1 site-specific integrase [Lichenibacterium minor]
MPRSSTTGLPFLVRRTDTGKFCYHRDVPAAVAAFITGDVVLPWKEGIHKLEGRPTVKVSLATGDEATARVRWNRVHEQVEALVQMGQVLAAEKEQRGRERKTVQRLPVGAVDTIAAQARHDLLAEHDQCWIDPTFTSPLTGVVVRLMRNASRTASLDPVDDARRFADDLRLRDAKAALVSRRPGTLDTEIEEGEVTDQRLIAAISDLAAGRISRLTPEQNAALTATCTTSTISSELDLRLAENGLDLPHGHPDRRALALALLRTTVNGLEAVRSRDAGAAIDTPARPPVVAPGSRSETFDINMPLLSAMRERWIKEERPLDKQQDDNALYTGYFISKFGDLPVDQITKPVLKDFMDLLERCPRNVPHAIRRASLTERIAWGEKPANLKQPRLARRTVNAKGLGSMSAALSMAEKLGHIAVNPCSKMGLRITDADVVKREPYNLEDLRRIFSTSVYVAPIEIPISGCGCAAHWLPALALFTGARLEELGQLLVGDIKQIEGLWCVHITDLPDDEDAADREAWWDEEEPGKAVKTAAARRYVPVHPELVRCGFLNFVSQRRRDGFRRLFPELKAYRGRTTKAWSTFWARHTDEHVTKSPRKTFHSFRHLFVARLRAAGVDRDLIKALVGHANKDVTAGYGVVDGTLFPIAVLHEALGRVRVDGLDLSHLHRPELIKAA